MKSQDTKSTKCKECGFKMIPNLSMCPNCNATHPTIDLSDSHKETSFDNKDTPPIGNTKGPILFLKSVEFKGSRKSNNIELTTKENVINRDSIDGQDDSISSTEHILIYKKRKNWYLDNKSSNKATFLQVNEATKLNHGDILLLGKDRFFKVEIPEEK